MKVDELKRQKGETERHYLARKIFFRYLKVKEQELKGSKIYTEFPPYGGRARADLALVIERPPVAIIEIWVEIQDTKLSKEDWQMKLSKIYNKFKPKSIFVVITENLSSDLLSILKIVSETLDNYQFFLVDTRKELIYNFIWDEKVKLFKINMKGNKIVKQRIEVSLDRFMR